jgi:hypothetical protein
MGIICSHHLLPALTPMILSGLTLPSFLPFIPALNLTENLQIFFWFPGHQKCISSPCLINTDCKSLQTTYQLLIFINITVQSIHQQFNYAYPAVFTVNILLTKLLSASIFFCKIAIRVNVCLPNPSLGPYIAHPIAISVKVFPTQFWQYRGGERLHGSIQLEVA